MRVCVKCPQEAEGWFLAQLESESVSCVTLSGIGVFLECAIEEAYVRLDASLVGHQPLEHRDWGVYIALLNRVLYPYREELQRRYLETELVA